MKHLRDLPQHLLQSLLLQLTGLPREEVPLDDTFSSPTTGGKSAEVDEELSVPEPPSADAAPHANGEGRIRNAVDIPVDELNGKI